MPLAFWFPHGITSNRYGQRGHSGIVYSLNCPRNRTSCSFRNQEEPNENPKTLSLCGHFFVGGDNPGKCCGPISGPYRRDPSSTKTCRADADADGSDAGGD